VFAARLDDRKLSGELFQGGFAEFVCEPFTQFIEWKDRTVTKTKAPSRGPYPANIGGFLQTCMYGLTGIQLGPGEPDTWCCKKPAMPDLWDGVQVEKIWVRGKPARLTARHGDDKAKIEV
jgi:hypothetical protein